MVQFRMISARMSRAAKLFLVFSASTALAGVTSACGTQRISVPKTQGPVYQGAVLFNQRCSGCHTLGVAATHGSAANIRTAQYNNGPDFDVRCERPATRVLYAIENGGFSGAIMPQNIVVGQQAMEVAKFVATYAGSKSPHVPGVPTCQQEAIGAIPSPSASTTTTTTSTTTAAAAKLASTGAGKTTAAKTTGAKATGGKTAAKTRAKAKHKP
jgi:mono/diheme cytochrome c family protein